MKIIFHKRFLKYYARLPKKLQYKVDTCVTIFTQNPFSPALRNHTLSGTYSGLRSINVTGDYRIIFRELSDGTYELVELIDVGTHSQLYG